MEDPLIMSLGIGVVAGVAVAFAIVHFMAASLTSVHKKTDAAQYEARDSLDFEVREDIFRGSRVERFRKEQPRPTNQSR